MSQSKEYTVLQVGRRNGGALEVLLTLPKSEADSRYLVERIKMLPTLLRAARVQLAAWRGEQLLVREVTGYDTVIDTGLLAGLALTPKALTPLNITHVTEWEVRDA